MSKNLAPKGGSSKRRTPTITYPTTLLEELGERTRLSWPQLAAGVGLGLTLVAVGAAYLDGLLAGPFDADFWRSGMSAPVLVAYLLLIQPTVRRLRDGAIDAFRPLMPLDDDDFRRLLAEASIFNRRAEWVAVGIGVAGNLLLSRPWETLSFWLTLYGMLGGGLLFGLLGFFIYSSLSGTRLFAELHSHAVDINVFDLGRLEPVGRWSLGIALAYVGGNTLSLLFNTEPTLRIELIITYIPLILAPVLVFFLNMLSAHRLMAEAKQRQLKMVRDSLGAASQALEERAARGELEGMEALLGSFTAWVAVEQRIEAVPDWPYTQSMMRRLAASVLVPVVALALQGLLYQLFLRFVPIS
jgi:hypothetical protein